MSRRPRPKFTVEQKVRILEEARAPNTTVAEVLRRHQLDETTFYRWERQAKDGAREALEGRRARNGKAADREIERLEQELAVPLGRNAHLLTTMTAAAVRVLIHDAF